MKILDIAGLQYFWTKIKALLSGKADDGDVVHKAGAETVTGLKTFSGELEETGTSSVVHGLEIRDPSTDREQTYNVNHISQIVFCDVNGNYYGGVNDHHRLGIIQVNKSGIDTRAMNLGVYKLIDNVIEYSGFTAGITNTNIKYATAPSTPNRNVDTDIITRDWIPQDTRIVHTSENEVIGGVKIFHTNEPDLANRNKVSRVVIRNDNLVKGTAPEHSIWSQLLFTDSSNNDYEATGSNVTNRISVLETGTSVLNVNSISIAAYKYTSVASEQDDSAKLQVGYDSAGLKYATAPSTSSSRNNGTDIITRDWLNGSNSGVVHTTGDESISGLKYFGNEYTASPDTYPANKSSALYVNDVSLVKGVVPSTIARRFINLLFLDSTKRDIEHKGCLGGLSWRAPADGPTRADTDISMVCWKFVPEGDPDIRDTASITVGYDADGVKHATAPSTSSTRSNGTDIVTRDWIPNDTRVVHTTGNETVSGEKTFTSNTFIDKSSPMLIINDSGTNPAAHSNIVFQQNSVTTAIIRLYKGGAFQLGRASSVGGNWYDGGFISFDTDGSLNLRSKNSSGTLDCTLKLDSSGTLTYNGPEPSVSDDSNKIATTQWVRDATGNFACNAATSTMVARSISNNAFIDVLSIRQAENNYRSCTIRCTNGNGFNEMLLGVHDENDNAPNGISIRNTNGTITTYVPTPATASNDNNIATTAFVKSQGYIDASTEQDVNALKYFKQGMRIAGGLDLNASNTCITRIQLVGNSPSYSDFRFQTGDSRVEGSTVVFYGCLRTSPVDGLSMGTRYGSETTWMGGPSLTLQSTTGNFLLGARNGSSNTAKYLTGQPNGTLQWNGQNIQVSSDERVKTKLSSIPDSILDSWETVEWGQFQYLDAVKEKGSSARLHVGLIAQQVIAAFAEKDSDACAYGILCHEVRDASPEVLDENGEVVAPAKDAVDLWMARYTEALCMEAAYMRRENARLKKRIAGLEERLAALELKTA